MIIELRWSGDTTIVVYVSEFVCAYVRLCVGLV